MGECLLCVELRVHYEVILPEREMPVLSMWMNVGGEINEGRMLMIAEHVLIEERRQKTSTRYWGTHREEDWLRARETRTDWDDESKKKKKRKHRWRRAQLCVGETKERENNDCESPWACAYRCSFFSGSCVRVRASMCVWAWASVSVWGPSGCGDTESFPESAVVSSSCDTTAADLPLIHRYSLSSVSHEPGDTRMKGGEG
jgi:hypothetical protein